MAETVFVGKWMASFKEWREQRESAQLRKRVEKIKIEGRPPVMQNAARPWNSTRKKNSKTLSNLRRQRLPNAARL